MAAPRIASAQRFDNRAQNYARYRPTYPPALIAALKEHGVGAGAAVADIGSGTGTFTRQLLEIGATVYAVEPSRAMRCAAELELSPRPGFISVEGTAEATTLPDASVAFVTCGQAFHWFDPAAAGREFRRILKPRGVVAIFWNRLAADRDPVAGGFRRIELEHGREAAAILARQDGAIAGLPRFYAAGSCRCLVFAQSQTLDLEGLLGRMHSASYMPSPGAAGDKAMTAALRKLFDAHAVDGKIRLRYETELFLGSL